MVSRLNSDTGFQNPHCEHKKHEDEVAALHPLPIVIESEQRV
jgi:hypothetical protein